MYKLTTGYITHFSLGKSLLSPDDIIRIAETNSFNHIVVADYMSISAIAPLTKQADKKGINVSFGVLVEVYDAIHFDKELDKAKPAIFKIYPKNEDGLKAIYQLLTIANSPTNFYVKPRLIWDDLKTVNLDNIIPVIGGVDSFLGDKDFPRKFSNFYKIFGDKFYIELTPINNLYFDRVNINATKAEKYSSLGFIISTPTMISKDKDIDGLAVNLTIQNRGTINKSFTLYSPSYKEITPINLFDTESRINDLSKRIGVSFDFNTLTSKTRAFAEESKSPWKKQPVCLPDLSIGTGKNIPNLAAELIKEGWIKRLKTKPINGYLPTAQDLEDKYKPRLQYEFSILNKMGFLNYFLVASDITRWAKQNGIRVNYGRGSVGGSLIAYLMGITDIDPIRFNLIFERFINPSRNDLPDADLDFMSSRRAEVIRYMESRFGEKNVAGISNYGELGAASAIRDVARVFGHNVNIDLEITKLIPSSHGVSSSLKQAYDSVGEIANWASANEDEWQNALRLEGRMRNYGKHAAGIIVCGKPLTEFCAVERRESERVINWDGSICEEAGLVKLDILGLSTLDTLDKCISKTKEWYGVDLAIDEIPIDDPKTLKLFAEGNTQGVFQFEGGSPRNILKKLSATSTIDFEDIVATNALNRPGPIEAGMVQEYIGRKNGDIDIEYLHPNMENALKNTYGVMVYQEQIMQISVDLCGFTLSEADNLRKAIGKKDLVKMAALKDKFIDGAFLKSGMDKVAATKLWDDIEGFASYAFNRSHSLAYSMLGYVMAYFKAHYPLAFFAASLSVSPEQKTFSIVLDAKNNGIKVMPPDINLSQEDFSIHSSDTIICPFNKINGISENTTRAIVTERINGDFISYQDFEDRVPKKDCNIAHKQKLNLVGAFSSIELSQPSQFDRSRRKDQYSLLKGIVLDYVDCKTKIPPAISIYKDLEDLYKKFDGMRAEPITRPFFGSKAKIMVITDYSSTKEDDLGKMGKGTSWEYIVDSIGDTSITKSDIYVTSLLKRNKTEKIIAPADLTVCTDMIKEEIKLLTPNCIVVCGGNITKALISEIKKGVMDYAGRVFYDKDIDANIVVGITPSMIFHDKEKKELLDDAFVKANLIMLQHT